MKYYVKKQREVEYLRCDVCYKKIIDEEKYYKVTTGHHDWEEDSVDSIEHKDICVNCINKFIKDYLDEGIDTAYIDLKTKTFFKGDYYEKFNGLRHRLVEEDKKQ